MRIEKNETLAFPKATYQHRSLLTAAHSFHQEQPVKEVEMSLISGLQGFPSCPNLETENM